MLFINKDLCGTLGDAWINVSRYVGTSVPSAESEMHCLSEQSKENAEHSTLVVANSYEKGCRVAELGKLDIKCPSEVLK